MNPSKVFKRWIVLKIHARFDRSLYNSNRDRAQLSDLVYEMQSWSKRLEDEDYGNILDLCSKLRALTEGRDVHQHIAYNKLERDQFLGTKLCQMYGACGLPIEAERCFAKIIRKDILPWTAVIESCSKNGEFKQARRLFLKMKLQPIQPDQACYIAVLKAFVGIDSLPEARSLHATIKRSKLDSTPAMARSLIDMYAKCDAIDDAVAVLESAKASSSGDAATWVATIAALAQFGRSPEAASVFRQMLVEGILESSEASLVELLQEYHCPGQIDQGKVVHSCITMAGLDKMPSMRAELIGMYARCGSLEDARLVFDESEQQNVGLYRAMVEACMWSQDHREAIATFREMLSRGVTPDRCIFLAALRACSNLNDVKLVHSSFGSCKVVVDEIYKSYLIRNYRRCPEVSDPDKFFEEMENGKGAPKDGAAKSQSDWMSLHSGDYVRITQRKHRSPL